ncbi:MAG TPA: glycosyltransferase [Patescibacteria group bacterium]|nr:glycosyltransferase [Patescibacteria group bacterium]
MSAPKLRVAIVHDWFVGGGAERVVEELHHLYPKAPIYTSYATDEWRKKLDDKIVTGWLQHLGKIRKFIPFLRIWWFSRLNFSDYDLVISSSGAEAKGIKVPPGTIHINYCHAPTHYYWGRYDEYMAHPGFGMLDPLARLGLKFCVGPLRKWDYRAAQRPDYLIANSTHIKAEIKKYYGRDAIVINPPVDTNRFAKANVNGKRHNFLVGGRLTPYKRNDLAVLACTKLGLPLTVFGDGPDRSRLEHMAGPTITFTGRVPDDAVVQLFASATAFLFPLVDDFGVVGIEALAAGTPIIAYKAGGALDYVRDGETGLFFNKQSVGSLCEALGAFPKQHFNHKRIAQYAQSFSAESFRKQMLLFIEKTTSLSQK